MIKLQELISPTGKTFLTIYYDRDNNWIYNDWEGYVTPENVKQGAMAVLDAFQTHNTFCGLNDNSKLVGPWDQVIAWIEKEWIPLITDAGLRYYAHVVDKDSFAAASAEAMAERAQGHFEMQLFNNLADARNWLRQCQGEPDSSG